MALAMIEGAERTGAFSPVSRCWSTPGEAPAALWRSSA